MKTNYEIKDLFEDKISKLIELKKYEEAKKCLEDVLFSNNSSNKEHLTEENMLSYIMLEIYFIEAYETCIWERFGSIENFKDVFWKLKFYYRRIWLQYPNDNWIKEFLTFLEDSRISIELLIVVAKYSCPSDKLIFCIECLKLFLPKEYVGTIEYFKEQLVKDGYEFFNPNSKLKIYNDVECLDNWNLVVIDAKQCETKRYKDKKLEKEKIAFVICANNDFYVNEVIDYIKCVRIPSDKQVEIIIVKNAKSMTSGYNIAMEVSDAKYKFYMHQDTFIVNSNIINRFIEAFEQDGSLGMLGLFGSVKLPASGYWWQADKKDMRMSIYQDAVMNVLSSKSIETNGSWECSQSIDGIFIATVVDVPWREDIFDGWHFYDISQGYEFRKNGYKTGIINSEEFLVLHETGMRKDPYNLYDKYCKIFLDNYINN